MNHACIKALLKGRMEVQRKYDSCGSVASCGSKSSDEDDDKECSSIYSAGVRSPTAVRCRSIKELEEQLANLRKENFNLKLRIYFLEERMGTNFHLDKESAVKKNIELMVEVESLRKELQEKQDLLCQAVKAMELEEEEHKKESDLKESENQILQQKIEDLNQRIQELEGTTTQDGDTLLQKIKALEVELAKEKETSSALSEILKSQSTETDVDVTALTQELQLKEQQINQLYNQLHEFNTKFVNSNQRTRSLESELDRLNIELQSKISEIEKLQNEVATRGLEADNLKSTAASLEDMYKKESEKSEKFKKAVLLCNNKMANLEKTCEMQRAKIRNLELKLDSVQNEVKKKAMELANSKSPVRRKKSPLTDVDSFSVPDSSTNTKKESSSTITLSNEAENEKGLDNKIEEGTVKITKEEKSERDAKMLKLKAEHYKACQIIKTMMGKQKERDCEIERLREKLRHMEGELQESRKKENQNGNAQKSNALHSKPAKTKHSPTSSKPASDLENSMADVTDDAAKLADQYKNLAAELEKQVKMLMETLKEKDHQMQRAKDSLLQEIKEKEDRITDLEFELITMNAEVNKSHNSSEKNDEGSEKLSTFWMKEIEEKDKEIERLQSELRKRTCDLQGVVNKELWEKNKEIERMQKRFGVVVDNKEHIIKELKQTLSSRDSQLNILKDKISELGLEIDLSAVGDALNNANVSDEIKTLQEQLKSCEEERKFFMEQIEVLQQKLKSYSDQEHLAEWEQLKTEHKHLKEELRRTEQLRAESNEICTTLSTRLEELAQFLGSLLQQKCVLGFLGWRRNNKLKQIVSQSLNLSRALTTSISQHPDQSLMQLSYISDLLNSTKAENLSLSEFFVEDDDNAAAFSIIPSDITLTYQSHLQHASADKKVPESTEEQAKIITVLRSQVENLKREVELRDREINKMGGGEKIENDQDLVNILMGLPETQSKLMSPKKIMQQLISPDKAKSTKNHDNQSESESWSEPDRTVSLARIGLDDESLKPHSSHRRSKFLTSVSTESTEDDLSHTLTRTPSKRSLLAENRQTIISLNEQVLELENKIKGKDAELLSAQVALFECDNMLKEERLLTEKHQQQFQELQSKLDELEQKLQNAVKNTNQAENELVRTKQQLEESLQALQEQKKVNQDLQNEIQELQSQKVQAIQTAEEAKEGARLANNELNETKQKLNKLQDDFKTFKQRHDAIQKEHEAIVRRVQQYAETEIAKAHASVEEMQNVIKKEYIKKTEVDRRVLEFEGIIQELEHLKDMLRKAEQKVKSMEQQEIQLKQTLHDVENQHREKMAALHKDKDSATLQYSEAILEKTKLANEKAILEQTVKNFNAKEAELLEQVGEFQKEVGEMKKLFQQQMVTTEREKCKLEVRVSELESLNAELRNKLIKLQVGEPLCSVSLPSSPNHVYDFCAQGGASINANPYSRQCSGYTSEEQQHSLVVNEQIQGAAVEAERHQANSSPDLGIESDQGRFSSLEANLPRPYLKTLELTASMNNLLDGDSQLVQYDCCINELCRKKSRAVITENNELKKSLIRTKRALDETVAQLKMANHHKKQVEKTICKQINKTSQVLRKARANLDSGSETDVCKY